MCLLKYDPELNDFCVDGSVELRGAAEVARQKCKLIIIVTERLK